MTPLPLFDRPGRFFKGNLHTHSTQSDGALPAEAVCRTYREAGYDFISLTDHFLDRYGFAVTDTSAFRDARFTTIPGAELHVSSTSIGELWHILAVGLPLDFGAPVPGESAGEIAARARAAGAYVVLVHPAWYGLTIEDAATVPDAHAIEIYNHGSALKNDRGDGSVLLDQLLNRGRRVTACASDDAHFHFEDAFGGWVMVKAEANEPGALTEALRSGDYYSTQGPEIRAISHDGERIVIECSPASAVILAGRGSRAENRFGDGLTRVELPLDRIAKGHYGRVIVVDAAGRRAWSNPIWFDRFDRRIPPPLHLI